MLEAIMNNLINIGWAMLIFLAAYLSKCGLFTVLQHQNLASAF